MNNQIRKKNVAGIQTEVDAAFLYQQIAKAEEDPAIAGIFQNLAKIERGHAAKSPSVLVNGLAFLLPVEPAQQASKKIHSDNKKKRGRPTPILQ
ncbi:MAG: hypothetical protein IPN20_08480 [Haliscomenobacter sp.]|nr:hypothetical protein [Haliscomenobacter sp.]